MPYRDPDVRREKARGYQQKYLDKAGQRERHRALVVARRQATRDWLRELKATLACVHCGEARPQVLDFHHREPGIKEFSMGDAIRRGYSRERILAEIAQCEVLCANCHRMEHADW